MPQKTAPVFVVATANDIAALPPELIRKGRFDEIFFVDLPDLNTRAEILRIHAVKRGIELNPPTLTALAQACEGFAGAEIEQAVVAALYTVLIFVGFLTLGCGGADPVVPGGAFGTEGQTDTGHLAQTEGLLLSLNQRPPCRRGCPARLGGWPYGGRGLARRLDRPHGSNLMTMITRRLTILLALASISGVASARPDLPWDGNYLGGNVGNAANSSNCPSF